MLTICFVPFRSGDAALPAFLILFILSRARTPTRAYLILQHTGGVHGEEWFQVCNVLVVLAMVLTFPLQLVPVMEVVDEWRAEGRCGGGGGGLRSRKK